MTFDLGSPRNRSESTTEPEGSRRPWPFGFRVVLLALALRAGWDKPDLEFSHINEVSGGPSTAAHLLTFDSVHGRWHRRVSSFDDGLVNAVVRVGDLEILYLEDAVSNVPAVIETGKVQRISDEPGARVLVLDAHVGAGSLRVERFVR